MRYRRPGRRDEASHTDDWLMTYADMITLLLCFFAIFLSVSIPKKEASQKIQVPHPIEEPDVLEGNLPFHGLPHGGQPDEAVPDHAPATAIVSVPVLPQDIADPSKTADTVGINPKGDSIVPPEIDKVAAPPPPRIETPQAPPPETADHLRTEDTASTEPKSDKITLPAGGIPETPLQTLNKLPISLPEIVGRLKSQGNSDIEQKGDRITTLRISSEEFFGSGSAALSNPGKAILRDVVVNLKSEKFKNYQVTVEGHTDDAPINTPQFPSNWELSTARASAVVHFLLDEGIPAQKLRAAGYADTFPVAPNRDTVGNPIPANQARNRRVVIKLEKIDKSE